MNLSPVVIFVYNRPRHTQRTLEALSKNRLADQSILYVYADGVKEGATVDQLTKNQEVRRVINSRKWCKEVKVIERDKNWGLADNIIDGVSKVVKNYGKVIVLEDDVVTAELFLTYMNAALDEFEGVDQVKTIAGYIEKGVERETAYFLAKGTSWGWATWERAWVQNNWNTQELVDYFSVNKKARDKLNFSGYPYYEMLVNNLRGKNNSWAIRVLASSIKEDGLHLTPHRSYVKNIGFDGSGTHCKNDDFFDIEELARSIPDLENLKVEEDTLIPRLLEEQRNGLSKKPSLPRRAINFIKRKINEGTVFNK